MPELPEVEHLRRTLAPRLAGRRVVSATLHRRDIAVMPGDPEGGFSRSRASPRPTPRRVRAHDLLVGAELTEPTRRGKQLALATAGTGPVVLVHLGMSGQVRWLAPRARLDARSHVHATWRLDDGSRLVFRDPRRFGGLWLLPSPEALETRWNQLGPDGLLTPAPVLAVHLAHALGATRRPIKAALLDQRVIAGVGNIYADEALFRARVRPALPADAVPTRSVGRLARHLTDVLSAAVEARGSSLRDYADADGRPGTAQLTHAVYGRAGQPCVACGHPLRSAQLAQRTTVWCETCQPG